MCLFLLPLSYLALHLLVYRALLLARWRLLRSERGIFLYHAGSFAAATATVALGFSGCRQELYWESLAFTIGAHGVYSLSFLELWSLAQGSYSLTLLERVDQLDDAATRLRLQESASIGQIKSAARSLDLVRLGLLHNPHPGDYRLTVVGKALASLCWLLLRLTNGKPLNR
jgi:hypothetical protein